MIPIISTQLPQANTLPCTPGRISAAYIHVDVSPRDLEETYLSAFRATVVERHAMSIMCAYNAIDGQAACTNDNLLKEHLCPARGFKGFVVSDCGAIVDVAKGHHNAPNILHASVLALQAGTDLSCSTWAPGFNMLAEAVRQKLVPKEAIDQDLERLYTARFKLGLFDRPGSDPFDAIPLPANSSEASHAIALKAAEEAMVLLNRPPT